MRVVTLLHPGSMGASIGGALAALGHEVRWVEAGRSEATRRRAGSNGLVGHRGLAGALTDSEVVLSICPPDAALAVAASVAEAGFGGVYVDANAIAPATSAQVGERVAGTRGDQATFVDGGIVGGPASASRDRPGSRLYLSGPAAGGVAALFDGTDRLTTIVLEEGGPTAASAVKVTYAAWTKGTSALLVSLRALARSMGVEAAVLDAWQTSQPGLATRSEHSALAVAPKAWRWIVEMEEIAATFAAAGLPDGFHRAAADVYRRLEAFKDGGPDSPEAVFDAVSASTGS